MMSKIEVTMNSVYETGKIRGYATAVVDDCIQIRGIKLAQDGPDEFDVSVSLPGREGKAIFSLYDDDFSYQLKAEVHSAYFSAIGVDMSVADPVEQARTNTKNLDVLITKMGNNPESTLKALANVNIDESFSVNRVEVREMNGIVDVQMPQRKTVDGYKEICSLTNPNYEKQFKEAVLQGYFQRLEMVEATVIQEENEPALLESGSETQEESQNQEESQEEMEEPEQEQDEPVENMGMGGMADV